jgi:LytS/YehU family sensor histidine kinase
VRHGIAPLVDGGTLRIRCHVRDGHLHIAVRNCGERAAANAGSGIGLTNTAERLRALYGAEHHFALERLDSGGCEATVRIPFRNGTLVCAS